MVIIGAEYLDDLFAGRMASGKMVFNSRGALIFPTSRQHREMKIDGISYEDNYVGNALAAMLRRDEIEIRFHRAFSERTVEGIVSDLFGQPEFSRLTQARVTYQGRAILG
jgi:hypothetical protein